MRKLLLPLLALIALIAFALPAQAAKAPSTTNQMWSTEVTSAYDGSSWLLLQADKISQPGNAVWLVQWRNADDSSCTYLNNGYPYPYTTSGQEGTQTGATWGPTSYTFAYAGQPVFASLQLAEATPSVVGVLYIGQIRTCDHGVLVSGQPGKPWKVLDSYVPLPWSQ